MINFIQMLILPAVGALLVIVGMVLGATIASNRDN